MVNKYWLLLFGEGNGNPLQYLAWNIPWTEEPGRLYLVRGVARVGGDLAAKPSLLFKNSYRDEDNEMQMISKAASWGCGHLRCAVCLFSPLGAAGFGSGMAYLPAVVMVGRYFQKRRALAQGLSTTGTGFGTFLMTVLLKYLCAEYGWRNAMFIQGAVSLNLCVCGALMRPLSPGMDGDGPEGKVPMKFQRQS